MVTSRCFQLTALMLGACLVAQAAQAQDGLPRRKPGLWNITMDSAGQAPQGAKAGAPMTAQHCVDEKSDEQMQRRALDGGGGMGMKCQQTAMKKTATGLEIDSSCTSPQGKSQSHIRFTGDFQSKYVVDSTTRFDPPMHGMAEGKSHIEAAWGGACPAGMKPGDMRIGGMTINVNQAMGAGPGGKPGAMGPEDMKKLMEQMKAQRGK
jgi:hypothetical protein